MQTYQKTPFIILAVVAIALIAGIYTYKTNPDITIDQPATSTVATTTPIDTPITTTVTPNGTCGLLVTSHNVNGKVSLAKPITVSGIVDNTNRQTLGCSWQMFEGQLGSAQAYVFVNNAWKSISKQTPVPVANWMTDKTTFTVELRIDTGTMNIAAGTPVKVVFTEENASGEPPVDTYTLPLITSYGELNQELMPITVYSQDKAALAADRCDATKPATFQVPKTTAVADTSLKLLFSEELSYYGVYKSVTIENGVAKVMLASDIIPDGRLYSSLSSCEIGHVTSVLKDTLTQYPSIKSVQLYSPRGKIQF